MIISFKTSFPRKKIINKKIMVERKNDALNCRYEVFFFIVSSCNNR